MPATLTYPGVYVEEISSGVHTITGVATSITAFIGRALLGPVNEPIIVNSFGDFERTFGGLWLESSMSFAVRDFYLNGGSQAIIVRLFAPSDAQQQEALAAAQAEAGTAADAVIQAATDARDVGGTTTDADVATAAEGAVAAAGAVSAAALSAATSVAAAGRGAVGAVPAATNAARNAVVTAAQGAKAPAVADASAAVPSNRARLAVGDATAAAPVLLNLEAAYEGAWGNKLRARTDYAVKTSPADLFNLTVTNTESGQTEVFRNLSVDPASPRRVDNVLLQESQLVRTRGPIPTSRPTSNLPAAIAGSPAVPAGTVPVGGDPFSTTNSSGLESGGQASDGRALVALDFTPSNGQSNKLGIYALLKTDLFNLLCLPPLATDGDMDPAVIAAAGALCEERRAMLVLDAPSGWNTTAQAVSGISAGVGTNSKNAAIYFPRLKQANPLRENQLEEFAACGAIAGVMARTDSTRGVWKAPAGQEASLVGVPALSVSLTDAENGQLNPLGVNCLRAFPLVGRVVWGARTLQGADQQASEWKYIPVRRTALYIEESLYRGTKWVVFEPNDEPLWAQIRLNVGAFMQNLFRLGAFQGKTPREAYFVKCDKETTTQNDINLGIVNILVGFAPLKPAEFVILKIQQIAGDIAT
ncbi:MAG TPA: phage tail sheath subtilisin-like domain-containing protein [Pyrinomonadaceae bacterium]|nr:phage tail sheath subtilisin-like domain-containing protein [Pyrinomonadaceae bacterium]